MADTVSAEVRSRIMSHIRGKDTKPEICVRSLLHRAGLRYGLHARDLPGKPDIVFRPERIAVFVNGCWWHRHKACGRFRMPKSNVAFWRRKFAYGSRIERRANRLLRRAGWRVLAVWECSVERGVASVLRAVAEKGMR